MQDFIYLDNNSTTKLDPRVFAAMTPFLRESYGNSSSGHAMGLQAKKAIEEARINLSGLIGSYPKEIIFTSGATEAINLAFKGLLQAFPGKRHMVTLQTEHKAVLEVCRYLESIGFEISYLPVKRDGIIDPQSLKEAIRKDTLLVSIMWVNNETGVIQDIESLCKLSKDCGAYFMTDATQAIGKIPVNVQNAGIDLLCMSGHKFHAPKGIGALYISKSIQRLVTPLIHGGGQEYGLRSGTLNTAGIVGLGFAAQIAEEEMLDSISKIGTLRDKLENELLEFKGSFINGNPKQRLFNTSNVFIPGLDSEVLIGQLRNIALSNGSACSSSLVEPSHVLTAMGLTPDQANSSLRISLSKFTTEQEVDFAANEIKSAISKLIYPKVL